MRHEVAAALRRRERDLIRIDTDITASVALVKRAAKTTAR
jgi:hypothetical protein